MGCDATGFFRVFRVPGASPLVLAVALSLRLKLPQLHQAPLHLGLVGAAQIALAALQHGVGLVAAGAAAAGDAVADAITRWIRTGLKPQRVGHSLRTVRTP